MFIVDAPELQLESDSEAEAKDQSENTKGIKKKKKHIILIFRVQRAWLYLPLYLIIIWKNCHAFVQPGGWILAN